MHDLLPSLHGQLDQVLGSLPYFIPEVYLVVFFLAVLVTDLVFGRNSGWMCHILAIVGLVVVIYRDLQQFMFVVNESNVLIFSGMLILTRTAIVLKIFTDLFALVMLFYFVWDDKLSSHNKGLSDLYTITVAAVFGMHLMTMASNLLSVYLSIEMVSIASYLMVAYKAENKWSSEAGLKYVLFGAASSAIMLYGISLLYGLGGSLDIFGMAAGLAQANPLFVSFALVLFFVGIGFKLSFVPMHFWVPDIYEGAPTPITAFLSTVPKFAAFALLISFLAPFTNPALMWRSFDFRLFFSVIGIATMIVGNFAAAMQNNVKRMLAYSSIGHTGFALMAIVTALIMPAGRGLPVLTFYLVAYALAGTAAWMLATYFADAAGAEDMNGYKGLGFKYPVAGVCFVIVLISLTGLPLTAGFYGKFLTFSAAYQAYEIGHNTWLLALMITSAVTTVVSLFYYIKIPLNLFLRKTDRTTGFAAMNNWLLTVVAIITILVVYLGLFPDFLTKYL
ncbi:MAG TPA: NADH-quinone oxidoreductase subunit N [Mucilaginibacter sp.]|jgi:NADH-quinone oxidoreductase subunit N|nr:NADH-quinone oxidoreductase subunit N [Mucilaginibacter sp.]